MRRNLSGDDVCSDPIRHQTPASSARCSPVRKSLLRLRRSLSSITKVGESRRAILLVISKYHKTVSISQCSTLIKPLCYC